MRRKIVVAAMLCLVAISLPVRAQDMPQAAGAAASQPKWILYQPDQIVWQDGPPSLLPGAKMAILEGDPSKPGFFTMRLKMPDGYKVYPHWHPMTERLTVISGTVNLGMGDNFDPKATKPLAAGTYSSMPPKMTHFAYMTGESILQLSSIGPWAIIYVNPADDPRLHAK
ncbi:MAG TPA: cupin domain-containing protein [Candidatus Binataceae bacterium]|nr:cupin domain-containing protein [Candidatus Binataceae bacterium]